MVNKAFLKKNYLNILMICLLLLIVFVPSAKAFMLRGLMEIGLFRPGTTAATSPEAMPPAANLNGILFKDINGNVVDLGRLKGKVVFLNFWATWCPPCIEELPLIDAFFRRQSTAGWRVVGLAIDRPDAVRRFLAATPVSFPIGVAGLAGTDLVRRLGNSAGGLPFTLVVTGDGRVSARKMGKLGQADLDAWRAQVHS